MKFIECQLFEFKTISISKIGLKMNASTNPALNCFSMRTRIYSGRFSQFYSSSWDHLTNKELVLRRFSWNRLHFNSFYADLQNMEVLSK